MNEYMNFSTKYYPLINKLKNWVSDTFYPSIKRGMECKKINGPFRIYTLYSQNGIFNILKQDKSNISVFENIIEELEYFKDKAGIYGVFITSNNESAFIYIGKSKDLKTRVRQHLTGKNLDESNTAPSVSHKYNDICELVNSNIVSVKFFIWTNKKLTKSSDIDYELGVLEALFIAKSKKDFDDICENNKLLLNHWNLRVG